MKPAERAWQRSVREKASAEHLQEMRELQAKTEPLYKVGDRVVTPVGDDGQMVEETVVEKVLKCGESDLRYFIGNYMTPKYYKGDETNWSGQAVDDRNDQKAGNPVGTTSSRKKRQACYKYRLQGFKGYRTGRYVMPLGTGFGPVNCPTKLY